jgi:hypothetical protein
MRLTTLRITFFKSVMLLGISLLIMFVSCKKDSTPPPPPADKTTLQAKIVEAQALLDGTVEGTKPGQYEAGSKTNLTTVLNAAKAVATDANATQEAVTNATAQLQATIDTYKTHEIKEIASANLIGYWKMNGNANDSSGNNNNGTLTAGHAYFGGGMPVSTTDRFGRANMAYHFDKGGNIEVPYKPSLNPQQFSISIWLKKVPNGRTLNSDTYTMTSLNRWNGYKFQLQSTNKLFLTVKGVSGTDTAYYDRDDATVVLDTSVWYHAIVTFKPGEMDFYLNGDLVKSWTNTPNPPITLGNPINFVIGQDLPTNKYLTVDGDYQVAWGGFWTGDLDDVMFYNVALDATQVRTIYNNQKSL